MLRKFRIAVAAVFFAGITSLFLGIGTGHLGWMARLQFLPSCLALNLGVVIGILLLTFILGRLYCSVICPLGVMQDIIIAIRKRLPAKSGKKFHFVKEHRVLRFGILAIYIGAIVASLQVAVAALAPYSAYGRIVRSIAGIADTDARNGGFAAVAIAAGITFVIIVLCAWFFGRDYCNSICPVGTVLSIPARFSIFRPAIDADKCIDCGKCERSCKASCIDSHGHAIDAGRCIDCFDCLDSCHLGAISYKPHVFAKKNNTPAAPTDRDGRRAFLTGAAMLGAGMLLDSRAAVNVQGGLSPIEPKQVPERRHRIVPPGAKSEKEFYSRCTSCQLCISNCPNHVLRPSSDLQHLMQPEMGYDNGWCRPECHSCSDVCPSGAILRLDEGAKLNVRIGTAEVDRESCISCGNCVRHCPNGALRMVKSAEDGKRLPAVNEELCIGCGACEYLCPVRPVSAIVVNGIHEQRERV